MSDSTGYTQAQHIGIRLDKVLAEIFPDWSRRELKRQLREGGVRVDGRRLKAHERVSQAGLRVELCPVQGREPADAAARGPSAEIDRTNTSEANPSGEFPTELLHASRDYLYLSKASGQHATMRYPGQGSTLAQAVIRSWPECATASEDPREGGAIHRLDQATSGVMAFARHREAWRRGRAALSGNTPDDGGGPSSDLPSLRVIPPVIHKIYLAITDADPQQQDPRLRRRTLNTPGPASTELAALWPGWDLQKEGSHLDLRADLGRGPQRERVALREDGLPTRTEVQMLAQHPRNPQRRLWWVVLHSGFRHQIRVVLRALGHPIAGDPLYQASPTASRLLLHAYRLDLAGIDGESEAITAPLPPDFQSAADLWPPPPAR